MTAPLKPDFRAFTITHNGIARRIVTMVRLAAAFDPQVKPDPSPTHIERLALWDTGATNSVITDATAQALKLTPVGQVSIKHAGGSSSSSTYLVNFVLPNNVGVAGVMVSQCPDSAGDFGAIVGMDIISQGDLSLTNAGGHTVMSFRTPAIQGVDYVGEANRLKYAGANRNAPCPCGKCDASGKPIKFKNCHGKTAAV
jgi:hypothetical protein